MKLIQYTQEGNLINIPGSNQVLDWLINLCPFPFLGFHLGGLIATIGVFRRLKPVDKSKPVIIRGHSLGGGIGSIISIILTLKGYFVQLETQGAFKAVSWWWSIFFTWKDGKALCRIYGDDPVPRFVPWFVNLALPTYEGPGRCWWKISFNDHTRY